MANASLVLETALLLLVAFVVGCVVGALARRLTLRRPAPAAVPAASSEAAAAGPPPLVAPPAVGPLFQRTPPPTAAERLAAAAGRSAPRTLQETEAPALPEPSVSAPVLPRPAAEPGPTPVAAPVGEAPRPARVAGQASAPAPAAAEHPAVPAAAPPIAEDDAEAAAQRAVEGDWTPPRRRSPAPFPEAAADPGDEAEAAMTGARSAVAAARAAAAAALAAPPEAPGEQLPLGPAPAAPDEQAPETPASGTPDGHPPEASPPSRPRRRFGAPELLDAPRVGGSDDLSAIRNISPSLAASLNALGIFHFDQLAGWDGKAVVWVDSQLGLKGRIARERWPEQARALARQGRAARSRR